MRFRLVEDDYKRFRKGTFDFDRTLRRALNLDRPGYYYYNIRTEDGENFLIHIDYPRAGEVAGLYNYLKDNLKQIGATKITKFGGQRTPEGGIKFFLSKAIQQQMEDKFNQEQDNAETAYKNSFENIDISAFEPSEKIMTKLRDYRDRGSNVNVKAIKDVNKALTYLYGALLLDWNLASDLEDQALKLGADKNTVNAIIEKVKNQETETRSPQEIKLNLPTSGLFTFEDKRCWLPRQVFLLLIELGIPAHIGHRTPGGYYDNNGVQWTEIEHIFIYPGTPQESEIKIAVHTLESGGRTTYTGPYTDERVGVNELIRGLRQALEK